CGKIGGGAVDYTSGWHDATASQWFSTCTNGGTTSFPYGDQYSPTACDGADAGKKPSTHGVNADPTCKGIAPPLDQVLDLSGNVDEWEDACQGSNGPDDPCRRRGGNYKSLGSGLRCDADDALSKRSEAGSFTGIRCCAD